MHILALDVGTSAVKAAVLDQATGKPIAPYEKEHYELQSPTPDAFEVAADRLRDAVWNAARRAVVSAQGARVEGIGLSCLTPALVLLDEAGKPLTPIWMHLDRRSRPIARQVLAEVGDEFLNACGNQPLPGGMSALAYRRQVVDDPSLPKRVRRYLHVNGWLGLLFTGEARFDLADASFTGLFNTLTDRSWSPRWCEYFGVDRAWLPGVVPGDATLGGLLPEVASDWGVPAGVPVKHGTADTTCGMLAAGMKPGDLYVTVGTTTVLARLVERPRPDPRRLTRLFGVGDGYLYAAHNPVGGSALAWMLRLCFREYDTDARRDAFYHRVVPEAVRRRPLVRLDPPFLGGDRLEIEPRRAAFDDLTLATDRMDLLAAVLTAMRNGYRSAFAALDWGDLSVGRIFLTGGGHDTLQLLVPELEQATVHVLDEASLMGVARLFDR